MKKKYLYNGQEYNEQQITDAAKQSGKSLDEYVRAAGIKVIDDTPAPQAPVAAKSDVYLLGGKEFTTQQVDEAAKQSGKSLEDYIGQAGLKKKGGGTTPTNGIAPTSPSKSASPSPSEQPKVQARVTYNGEGGGSSVMNGEYFKVDGKWYFKDDVGNPNATVVQDWYADQFEKILNGKGQSAKTNEQFLKENPAVPRFNIPKPKPQVQEEVVEAEIVSGGSNKLDWRERLNENLKTAEDRFSGTQTPKVEEAPLAKTYKPKVDLLAETEMRAREKAIEQNKQDINGNIVFNTEVVAFDPERPSDSKYRNAIYQANVLLDKALPELQKLGFGNITKEQLLSSPENYGKINTAISAYYDNEIEKSKALVIGKGGISPTTGVSTVSESRVDTDETRRLRAEKQDVINKILKPLYSSIIVEKNPSATSQVIGKEIMKVFSPKDYEALQLSPNLMRQGYDADNMGYEAKLENLRLRAESGEDVQQEANKIVSDRGDLEYAKYPEIRKNKIRMLVMESLANKGELGGIGDMAPTKALRELKALAANPPDRRDLPLIQQMIDDLDIRMSGDMSIAERDKTRETWYKEAMQYKNQGIVDRYIDGLSGYSSEIAKGVASIFKSDKTKLGEIDLEGVSTRKYIPSSFSPVAPTYVIDAKEGSPTRGQMILNPEAGKFNWSAVPYATADGAAQLTVQLIGAELTGGLASGLAKGAGLMGVGTGVIGKAAMANTKLFMPSFLMTFDQNSKQALEIFGAGDDAVFKRLTYSYVTSALEGATEKIGNVYDQLGLSSVLKGEVKDQIAQNIGKLSLTEIKKLGRDELQQKLSKVVATSFGAVKGVGKDLGQETIEELANNVGEFMTSALLDQSSVENRNLFEELRHTAQETFASMAFLGVKGAIGGSTDGYSNSSLTKGAMFEVATRPDEYRDAIAKMKQAGDISETEANEKLFIVNAAAKAKQNWEVAKPLVRAIVGNDDKAFNNLAQQFVQARSNEIALQKEIDKDGVGDAVKKSLQKQVGKWQKVQEFVLNKKVYFDDMGNPSLVPVTVGNMVEVQAKTETGEIDVMFVPVDEKGKVRAIETSGGVSVIRPDAAPAAEEVAVAETIAAPARRLQGRLSRTKGTLPVTETTTEVVVEKPQEVVETAPDNKAEIAAAEQNLSTKLADLAKWRDEQNAAIRQMYQDSPDPDAWVEPYNKLTEEYNAKIEEISAIAGQAYPKMAKAEPKPIVEAEAAEPMQLPKRNDDFMRKYMSEAEQESLSGKTPEQKAEIIEAKREEVLAAAPSVEVQPTKGKIALSDKFTDTKSADNAVNEINELGVKNPLNENQVVIDNVKVSVQRDGGNIVLNEISAIEQGKGSGTSVLNKIKEAASKNNVDVVVSPTPIGNTSKEDLVKWYKKNGFEEHTQGRLIYKAAAPKEDTPQAETKKEAKSESAAAAVSKPIQPTTKDQEPAAEVDAYEYQDKNAEPLISKSGTHKGFSFSWKNNEWRYRFENAGDVLRELTKYIDGAVDPSYIYEKINALEGFLKRKPNFRETSEDAAIINKLKEEYENQPVYSEAQNEAKKLILNLLNGKISEATKQIEYFDQFREGDTKANLQKANQRSRQKVDMDLVNVHFDAIINQLRRSNVIELINC